MFGYRCQECGRGTVQETRIAEHETRFGGERFVVPDAIIGVCDACEAQHFNAGERKRWRRLFDEGRELRVSTHVRLPESVHRKLQQLRETRNRSQSDVVAELIRQA